MRLSSDRLAAQKTDVMTVRRAFEYNELDSLAELLEQKAAEGWELTSKNFGVLGFRRCARKKVKVSVELVPRDVSEEDREQFVALCEEAGWRHIFDDGKIQIFENDDLEAEPIHTDPMVKLQMIHRKCRASLVYGTLAFTVFAVWMMNILIWPGLENFDNWFTCSVLWNLCTFPALLGLIWFSMARYLVWYRQARKLASAGVHPPYQRHWTNRAALFAVGLIAYLRIVAFVLDGIYMGDRVVTVAGFVLLAGAFLPVYLFNRYDARSNQDRRSSKGMLIGICVIIFIALFFFMVAVGVDDPSRRTDNEDMALFKLSDLGITEAGEEEHFTNMKMGSPVAQYYEGESTIRVKTSESGYDVGRISYEVCHTRISRFYDWMVERAIFPSGEDTGWHEVFWGLWESGVTFAPAEDKAFGADAVYTAEDQENKGNYTSHFILLYDNNIVYLKTNIDLTAEQKEIIRQHFDF